MIPIVLAMNSRQLANETVQSNGMIQHGFSLDMLDLKACPKWNKFLKPKNNNLYLNKDWALGENRQLFAQVGISENFLTEALLMMDINPKLHSIDSF